VSRRPHVKVAWGEQQRLRLRASRKHAGHDMVACAEILRAEFGVAAATQSNISRWETGAVRRPQCVSQLLAYCERYGPPASTDVSVIGESEAALTGDLTATSEVDQFDRLARQAAGEPLLGPAQLELVKGMTRRLANGPPLSPEDRATYLDQLRILGVVNG
jgi:hypothetical protein